MLRCGARSSPAAVKCDGIWELFAGATLAEAFYICWYEGASGKAKEECKANKNIQYCFRYGYPGVTVLDPAPHRMCSGGSRSRGTNLT